MIPSNENWKMIHINIMLIDSQCTVSWNVTCRDSYIKTNNILPQIPIESVQLPATVSKVIHFYQLSWVSMKLLSFGKLFPKLRVIVDRFTYRTLLDRDFCCRCDSMQIKSDSINLIMVNRKAKKISFSGTTRIDAIGDGWRNECCVCLTGMRRPFP